MLLTILGILPLTLSSSSRCISGHQCICTSNRADCSRPNPPTITTIIPNLIQGSDIPDEFEMDYSLNQIIHLKDNSFGQSYKPVTSLFLQRNIIRNIDSGAFAVLTKLKILDLSYNGVEQIEVDTFKHNKRVTFLNLGHNRLKFIPENAFHEMSDLTHIELNDNNLVHVFPKTFTGPAQIERLYRVFSNFFDHRGAPLEHMQLTENVKCQKWIFITKVFFQTPWISGPIKFEFSHTTVGVYGFLVYSQGVPPFKNAPCIYTIITCKLLTRSGL